MKEFIRSLNSHHVEYLVVGGHAVAFHGHPRFTGDMDFLIRPTPENAERLLAVLDDFGFAGIGITSQDLVDPGRVVQLGHPPNRIDILTSISGVDFSDAWKARIETAVDDQPVTILGSNELLQNKRATGRPKDLIGYVVDEGFPGFGVATANARESIGRFQHGCAAEEALDME